MTTPVHDLSKLRIDRDEPPPELRRALKRNAILLVVVLAVIAVVVVLLQRGGEVPVQTVLAEATGTGSSTPGAAGATSVTANGYVVARTWTEFGPAGPWLMATLYGTVLGLFMFFRFQRGRWKSIRLERHDDADRLPGFEVVPVAEAAPASR